MQRRGGRLLYGGRQVRRLFAQAPSSGAGKRYCAWIEEQRSKGALTLHPAIEVRRSHNKGYGLFVKDCTEGGIEENTPLVELAPELLSEFSARKSEEDARQGNEGFFQQVSIFASSVTSSETQQKNLRGSVCLSVQLLMAAADDKHPMNPYSSFVMSHTYPWSRHGGAHILAMDERKFQWMDGTALYKQVRSRIRLYTAISEKIFGRGLQESCLGPLMGIVLSRAMSGSDNRGTAIPLGLAPVIDFSNHSETPNAQHTISLDSHGKPSLTLNSTCSISAGSEVSISYGDDRSSSSFLCLYGFLPTPLQATWSSPPVQEGEQKQMPTRLLNRHDALALELPIEEGEKPLKLNVAQVMIYDLEIRMRAAFSGKNSGSSDKEGVRRAFQQLLELMGITPTSAPLLKERVEREVNRLNSLLKEQEKADAGSHTADEPPFLTQCGDLQAEKKFLLQCKAAVDTEYYAAEALLECCRLYVQHDKDHTHTE